VQGLLTHGTLTPSQRFRCQVGHVLQCKWIFRDVDTKIGGETMLLDYHVCNTSKFKKTLLLIGTPIYHWFKEQVMEQRSVWRLAMHTSQSALCIQSIPKYNWTKPRPSWWSLVR
jgi:hypothetical protein